MGILPRRSCRRLVQMDRGGASLGAGDSPLIWTRQLGQARDAAKLAALRKQAIPRWARLILERHEREQLKNNHGLSDGGR